MTNTDIINYLAQPTAAVLQLRQLRAQAVENAQLSFEALLEGELPERYAVAERIAQLIGVPRATEFYADLAADEPVAPGARLDAALEVATLLTVRPKAAGNAVVVGHLAEHFSDDEIVTLTQLIGFLNFQLRLIWGLQLLSGSAKAELRPISYELPDTADWRTHARTISWDADAHPEPTEYVRHSLGWNPWVAPVPTEELSAEQLDALIEPTRARMPYFQLLARDPQALRARTLTDLDIFQNPNGGIGRAERELAASVTSITNGCIYCTSVHAARAVSESSGREHDVDALLRDPHADLGSQEWNTIANIARDLTELRTPQLHLLDDAAALDIINSTAFFNWANRLMLVLGQPETPERYRK